MDEVKFHHPRFEEGPREAAVRIRHEETGTSPVIDIISWSRGICLRADFARAGGLYNAVAGPRPVMIC